MSAGFAVIGSEAPSPRLLELAAYCGYKYVLCIICMLVGLLLGSLCFYVSVLACGSCMGLFMMRTINPYLSLALNNSNGSLDSGVGYPSVSHSFPSSASSANNAGSKKFATTKRNYLLLALGVFQLIMLYLLVRSTLSHTSGGGLLGLLWGSGGGGDDGEWLHTHTHTAHCTYFVFCMLSRFRCSVNP